MLKLYLTDKTPVYAQIVQGIKSQIMTAKVHAHEQLPSVRMLAKQLGINPNTVQKSYALLKKQGLIYSVAGKGDFVADNAARVKEMKRQQIIDMFVLATQEARDSGMWIDEIISIVDDAYTTR